MGTLRDFDLPQFGCDVFFETGTGHGFSLTYALASGCFTKLYSVEIDQEAFELARALFSPFRNLQLLQGDSVRALHAVLPLLSPQQRVLFFLDAHFPGETTPGFRGYKAEASSGLRLPLERELEAIRELRPDSDDVILADDLRIYEDGPFESGNMPDWAETLTVEQKNLGFVTRIFPQRSVQRYYQREGYLLIT